MVCYQYKKCATVWFFLGSLLNVLEALESSDILVFQNLGVWLRPFRKCVHMPYG